MNEYYDLIKGSAVRSMRMIEARRRGRHSRRQWLAMLDYFGHTCVRCGSTDGITKDHVVSILDGGSNSIENLQPLCGRCNALKGSKSIDYRPNDWRICLEELGDKKLPRLNDGSKKRMMTTSPERRTEIASNAAKKRWENRRLKMGKSGTDVLEKIASVRSLGDEVIAVRTKPPTPELPKEFGLALAAAERDYEKSLQQLAYYEEMSAMFRARIPFLAQAIRALGGSVGSAAEANGSLAMRGPEINYPPPENLPVIPVARGGSMGVINDAKTAEDENQFLRDAEGVGAGGGWQ